MPDWLLTALVATVVLVWLFACALCAAAGEADHG